MSKKLTLLVPAFLAVFALLASSAATAQTKTPKEMPPGMWNKVKSQMNADNNGKRHGMILAIDVQKLKDGGSIAGAVHGWFAPGKKEYIPVKPGDPYSDPGVVFGPPVVITVLVHNPHICWQAGGDWRCVTF